jgi:hypothetical protein
MLQFLSDEGVKYLVVGACALAVHGFPRATKDMDVFVWANPGNAAKVFRTAKALASLRITPGMLDLTTVIGSEAGVAVVRLKCESLRTSPGSAADVAKRCIP